MKRIDKELQEIRRQMEEDYMLHAERLSALKQSNSRVDQQLVLVGSDLTVARLAVGELQSDVGELQATVGKLQTDVGKLQVSVGKLGDGLGSAQGNIGGLTREYREFGRLTQTYLETWAMERKRNLRTFDLIQTSLLTNGLKTDARFERLEKRLDRLEDGAA
ncbi:MAG: hypothetical protein KF760_12025 [Candidatus Eremiobacteraeota bacterium]|nr:hypothetical protein [Candidatus Eremiobacteraeota bacterium]MCW5868210.1 hypothetical protein [Candidatus Eremiobacteraeota bacterium]